MVDISAKSVGNYALRLVSGLAVILGILVVFTGLTQPSLFSIVFGLVLIIAGAFGLKRSGGRRPAR